MTRDRYAFPLAFAILLLANLLPLTAEYLPFCDLFGHMGLAAARGLWTDPGARIQQLYTLNPRPVLHSVVFEQLGGIVTRVLPATIYANGLIALGYVAALPLSLAFLLYAFDRDVRLSLLIFPVIYMGHVWFGFVNFIFAVPLVLVGLALVRLLLDDAPTSLIGRWRMTLLLAITGIALVVCHFFGLLVLYGLCALLLLMERPRPALMARVVLALAPAAVFIARWPNGDKYGGWASVKRVLNWHPQRAELLRELHEWSVSGVKTVWSDVVLAAFVAGLALAALHGLLWRAKSQSPSKTRRAKRLQPLALLVVTSAMFILLPYQMKGWWGVNIRLVPFMMVFAILALPAARRPTPLLWLAPALVAGLGWGLYLTWDFHHWYNAVDMRGADATVDAIPQGRRVLTLLPEFEAEPHYRHYPSAFAGAIYVMRRGGLAAPMMAGDVDDAVIRPLNLPAVPSWGRASRFNYKTFGKPWDYFLVKAPASGILPSHPFKNSRGEPKDSNVRLIARHGQWEAWENLREPPPLPHAPTEKQ